MKYELFRPYTIWVGDGEYKIAPYDAMGPRSPHNPEKEPRTSIWSSISLEYQ